MHQSIVGLGKLGLTMAAIHAYRGYEVIGLDVNEWLVNEIKAGRCPIYEPGLEEMMAKLNNRLRVTTSYDEAIGNSDVSFIIVPTPSGEDGKFTNKYVLSAMRGIAPVLKKKDSYHLIVVTSTVMPGSMSEVIIPELERISDKKCGVDFGACYSPEFIALGNVINGMLNPDAVLIGESDKKAGDILEGIYKKVCTNNPPIRRMNWWNAEVAKISLNVFLTTKISLANMYAEVCERIPNGDVEKIVGFLGLDNRIGDKFLRSGLGFAGTCLPRDNRAFVAMGKDLELDCPIQQMVDDFNHLHLANVTKRIIGLFGDTQGKTVSILGVTYNPNIDVVEESRSLLMAKLLCEAKIKVKLFDPAGMENAKKELGDLKVEYAEDIQRCLEDSDLCVLATPWEEFKKLEPRMFSEFMRKPAVLDCWRVWDRAEFTKAGVEYHAVGESDVG